MKINKFLSAVAVSRFLSTAMITSSSICFLSGNCDGDKKNGDETTHFNDDELEKELKEGGLPDADVKKAVNLLKSNGLDSKEKMMAAMSDLDNMQNQLIAIMSQFMETPEIKNISRELEDLEVRFKNASNEKDKIRYSNEVREKKSILAEKFKSCLKSKGLNKVSNYLRIPQSPKEKFAEELLSKFDRMSLELIEILVEILKLKA